MRPIVSAGLFVLQAMALYAPSTEAAVRAIESAQPDVATSQRSTAGTGFPRSDATCRRWRALAARLGETYAGHKLRAAVANRLCAFSEDGPQESSVETQFWGWPWRHSDVRADLPPQKLGIFGSWEIRCAQLGARQRCALALETAMAAGLDPESRPIRIVSHLVIDTVAGREIVLWRIHLARDMGNLEAEGGVAIQLPGRDAVEAFDACGRRGCMAEAEPRLSAEVASSLWAGRSVAINLGKGETGQTAILTAHGFRKGLAELIKLRRHEERAVAGR